MLLIYLVQFLPDMAYRPVSYTHLDVYKRQGIGKLDAAFVFTVLLVGKHSNGIGISLKVDQICPLLRRKFFFKIGLIALEITGNGIFTRMPKRRVAHIVAQTCRRNNVMKSMGLNISRFFAKFFCVMAQDKFASGAAQTSAHGRDLQGMRKPVMHKDTAG